MSAREQITAEMRKHFDAKRGYLDPDEIGAYLAPLVDRLRGEAAAEALEQFAVRWHGWVVNDAPQTRGGAAYRARCEAIALRPEPKP